MARKRLTQIFPALLPLRQWQRKKMFYMKMNMDGNKYAVKKQDELLENTVFETSSLMINENSGYDIRFQLNKVHNLKLAAKTIDRILIRPQESFSFWMLVRHADDYVRFKDGLSNVDGKTIGAYGGGLCQLSNMLFWMFLHGPFAITERRGHDCSTFPTTTEDLPAGTDATVSEGWLDLKVTNETCYTFQLEITFDSRYMYGRLLSDKPLTSTFKVFNSSVEYVKEHEKIYQIATVCRSEKDRATGLENVEKLYCNRCEIAYELSEGIVVNDCTEECVKGDK